MKRLLCFVLCLLFLLPLLGCSAEETADIAASTLPVYDFTSQLCEGTGLKVSRLITEEVSCLHDYSLSVRQVRMLEAANAVVISGAGLEEFLEPLLANCGTVIDSSLGISLLTCEEGHEHDEHGAHHHHHEADPHIWLSPVHATVMARNIFNSLVALYPEHRAVFEKNYEDLCQKLLTLDAAAREALNQLSSRELVTFHDGFSYLAQAYGLEILMAVEEESGSESSARELKELITLVREKQLPAIFTERSGSVSAAGVIHAETGVPVFALDMAMAGDSYFDAMYYNIEVLKEALG